MERYAKAASALENGMVVDEGDVEDQEHEIELGKSDYTFFCRKCDYYLEGILVAEQTEVKELLGACCFCFIKQHKIVMLELVD